MGTMADGYLVDGKFLAGRYGLQILISLKHADTLGQGPCDPRPFCPLCNGLAGILAAWLHH